MKFIYILRVSSVFLLATLLGACATAAPLEGRVLEYGTDKPIPNAIVIARWEKGYLHSTACVHVETGSTDEQGRFRLSGYEDKMPRIDVYALGYARFNPSTDVDKTHLYVKLSTESKRERLEHLVKMRRTTGCYSDGKSEKNLLTFREALYTEAKQLAQTKQDEKTLEDFLYSKEISELGYEAAQKRHLERLRK